MAYADYRRQGVESPVVSQSRTDAISNQNVDAIPFAISGLLGIVWVNLHDSQIRDAGIADGEG